MLNPAPNPRSLAACPASLSAALLLVGCAGPTLQIDNPNEHRVFVDGVEEARPELPFRYYGTVHCDVLPANAPPDSRQQFRGLPTRHAVVVAPPASPWWFPFDLPIELWSWARHGQTPTVIHAELTNRSNAEPILPGVQPSDLRNINERAWQARISR
jgi:hypothetical protein